MYVSKSKSEIHPKIIYFFADVYLILHVKLPGQLVCIMSKSTVLIQHYTPIPKTCPTPYSSCLTAPARFRSDSANCLTTGETAV